MKTPDMPDMLDLWIKIQKDIPTDSVVTFKMLKEREGYKPDEIIIFGGAYYDEIWFDEMYKVVEFEAPKKKNVQHGPLQKGKKGKLKRW